jgi:hypothetical protein
MSDVPDGMDVSKKLFLYIIVAHCGRAMNRRKSRSDPGPIRAGQGARHPPAAAQPWTYPWSCRSHGTGALAENSRRLSDRQQPRPENSRQLLGSGTGGCSRNWSGEGHQTAFVFLNEGGVSGGHQVCTCQYGIAGLHRLGSGPGPCLGGDARIVVSQRPCASRLSVYWRWRPPPCMGWAVWLQGSCCRIPEHLTVAGLAKEITGGGWVPPRITGGNGRCLDRSKGTFCQRGPSPTEMTIPRANIVEVGLLPLAAA